LTQKKKFTFNLVTYYTVTLLMTINYRKMFMRSLSFIVIATSNIWSFCSRIWSINIIHVLLKIKIHWGMLAWATWNKLQRSFGSLYCKIMVNLRDKNHLDPSSAGSRYSFLGEHKQIKIPPPRNWRTIREAWLVPRTKINITVCFFLFFFPKQKASDYR
jgi:hypothetical protein